LQYTRLHLVCCTCTWAPRAPVYVDAEVLQLGAQHHKQQHGASGCCCWERSL
jgi:hypothetical protein